MAIQPTLVASSPAQTLPVIIIYCLTSSLTSLSLQQAVWQNAGRLHPSLRLGAPRHAAGTSLKKAKHLSLYRV